MEFTLEKFLFDIPIYTQIKITQENVKEFSSLINSDRRDIEGYNPIRKVQSTFTIVRDLSLSNINYGRYGGFGELQLSCKRYGDVFRYYCYYDSTKAILLKIGQYPSVADIHVGEIKQYSKLLSQEKLKEFTRAIGLAANGVGIGSFVYLRRIFEYLIDQAYKQGTSEGKVDNTLFVKSRMDEKIVLLKDYLPPFLVENRAMYSVLSYGVHELDENTCLEHFDTLRLGIEIILDEKLEELRKREKINAASKKLQEVKMKLNTIK